MSYENAFKDHKYLWSIGAADDMTGGYVDQEDLAKLLKSPTKQTAEACLVAQIEYWFQVGPDCDEGRRDAEYWIEKDPKVAKIADRYT